MIVLLVGSFQSSFNFTVIILKGEMNGTVILNLKMIDMWFVLSVQYSEGKEHVNVVQSLAGVMAPHFYETG